jgi:hypothetical protein
MKSFLRNAKFYNLGGDILAHLPDVIFWFIWPIWRGLTESLVLKSARKEFNDAVKLQVRTEEMISLYPNRQELKEQLKKSKDWVDEAYKNLMEKATRHSSQNG